MNIEEFKIPDLTTPAKLKTPISAEENKTSTSSAGSPVSLEQSSKPQVQSLPKIPCPYIEPQWSRLASVPYGFEVLKNGVILDVIKNLESKPFWVFGRIETCDIFMAHPTISRYHAVLQYRPQLEIQETEDDEVAEAEKEKEEILSGWYLFDLGSTHGSFVNKKRIPNKSYIRVKVGHMIQLGASTRRYILQGPSFDEEEESELSVTDTKALRIKKQNEILAQVAEKNLAKENAGRETGISWGMADDADEETDLTINPFASTNNEEIFLDDPKKTLRGYFEREGLELDYKVDEMSAGTFVCRIELPIDDANGRPITAEVCHKGKKKDAVFQGALEACRILDRHGVLRTATHESRKRKQNNSDSEDEFWDRTGDVERRKQRKEAASKTTTFSHADLLQEEVQLLEQISQIDAKVTKYHEMQAAKNKNDNEDDLDSFMTNLSKEKQIDKMEIRKLRIEQQRLKQDHSKLQKLIKLAAPADLPPLILANSSGLRESEVSAANKKKLNLPLFGKRPKLPNDFKIQKPVDSITVKTGLNLSSDEEEIEDDGEVIKQKTESNPVKGPAPNPNEESRIVKLPSVSKHLNVSPPKRTHTPLSPEISTEAVKTVSDLSPTTTTTITQQQKKKRSRQRIREKNRENVDMDENGEEESTEKYSKWVPPQNQAGDGFTELNKKFGY